MASTSQSSGLFSTKDRRAERMSDYTGAEVSENVYNATLGLTVTGGLALTAVIANLGAPILLNISPLIMVIGFIAVSLISGVIMNRAQSIGVSLLGFGLLSAATGALLSWVVLAYDLAMIQTAVLITGGITAGMMILSTIFPAFFRKLGPALGVTLLLNIIAWVVCGFFFRMALPALAWVGVVLFSLYIGYDWSRAQAFPKTVKNAINSAADIYLDVINVFLYVLQILGNSSRR